MTSTIAMASAVSVPGLTFTQWFECSAVGVNSGEIAMTFVPL